MLKLLLIAPTLNQFDVGEAWVAYQWAHRLSDRHDVTLLTYNMREQVPASEQVPGARVIEWIEPPLIGKAERLNSMLKPAYVPFYVKARRWIKRALAAGEHFDVAHQPLPVAMRYPTPVAGLAIPYVMGPVGGSLESPPGFSEGDTAPWYVGLRSLDRARIRRDPLLRRTYEGAACVVGIAPYVAEFLSSLRISRMEIMSETGVETMPEPIAREPREDVRLLFVGRLIRTKGARDAILALARVRRLPVSFDIVGDGFDRAACEQLCIDAGLTDRVRFHGALPRERVTEFYRSADVFLFPSFREPGGNVVFEAMTAGLPLIVCDRGGPGNVVDDLSGIRVPADSPEQYARDLADAIHKLTTDRALRVALGEGARRRAADVALWGPKIDRIGALYEDVLRRHGC